MKGKTILITGGTSGLGAAAARVFAAMEARVIFCGRRLAEGLQMETSIRADGGEATFVQADVTNEQQVEHLVNETCRLYGPPDAAFNNAGANLYTGPLDQMTGRQFSDTLAVNLTGTFHSLKYEIQAMKSNGGSIINTASTAGVKGVGQGIAAYVAAKHGVIGLTKAAALEQARNGIRVNALVVSAIQTEQWLKGISSKPGMQEKIAAAMPTGRISTVEDIIPAILFLASEQSTYITGAAIPVDGGITAG
ncbi:SDR family oxidoreductase [Chitinophaga sp. G-6-1-13]|uniref:SDR family oxidoreductase n=1 Tax=Chitinophaga fulva TaxID=2728842 RepID=A0A848GVU3_9BACT|nr:SDR family oxidoreductase [Chitinophaga fulva]NML40813.1 SDR family oxidoreductase [Chitinophaga fulva]